MDNQDQKTPRELEDNSSPSDSLLEHQISPTPPPPSYISHLTNQAPTSIPYLHTSPRASSESSHSSYRDKFIIEEYHDKRRSRKALLLFAGMVSVVALVVAVCVFGGVYQWGRSGVGY